MIEVDALPLTTGDAGDDVAAAPASRRMRLRHLPITLYLGGALVTAFVAVALLSFVWTPYPPNELHLTNRLAPPGTPGFLLGTDRAGRDVVTELMLGARNSLYVSVVSTIVALITGAAIGLAIAGTSGLGTGAADPFRRRGARAARHPHRAGPRREVRPGEQRRRRSRSSSGRSRWRLGSRSALRVKSSRWTSSRPPTATVEVGAYVLVRHVLPNISPLLIVLGSVMFAAAILIEAALAFLGVGVQPPASSWGRFLSETQSLLDAAPYLMFFPGVAIILTALGFNLLGDGLRTVLDPQQARTGLS